MVLGIMICHGDLAVGLSNAAGRILGPQEGLLAFSNSGLAPRVLYQRVMDALREHEGLPAVIMVDIRGGSCWTVARMINREYPEIPVLSGVNLPMVVSFLTKREREPFENLPELLISGASKGLALDR
ncbi:MAG TPA: hypothetical protein PKV71_13335 [Calditrichia bacterium]|nr:hypothetical protein [Calditrichia bacterium]